MLKAGCVFLPEQAALKGDFEMFENHADMSKVTVIGTGNMGGAFAEALAKNRNIQLSVYDSCRSCAEKIAKAHKNVEVLSSMDEAVGTDIILIAVKPQVLPSIYERLSNLKSGLFISIAAGVTLETLRKNLKTDKVARFMPNIAAKIGHAVTAVAFSPELSDKERSAVMKVALSAGSAFELEEKLFAAFIGISGSGIAYVFEFMHQMAMGGVREGIAYNRSLEIVADTMLSAVYLQKSKSENAVELETRVCSARGATIEGVKALTDGNFGSAIINAVSAAAKKSEDMEKRA